MEPRWSTTGLSATSSPWRLTAVRSVLRLPPLGRKRLQPIERAHHRPDRVGGHPRVERRRVQFGMPQQYLDHPDVSVLLQKVRGKAVPECLWRDPVASASKLRDPEVFRRQTLVVSPRYGAIDCQPSRGRDRWCPLPRAGSDNRPAGLAWCPALGPANALHRLHPAAPFVSGHHHLGDLLGGPFCRPIKALRSGTELGAKLAPSASGRAAYPDADGSTFNQLARIIHGAP